MKTFNNENPPADAYELFMAVAENLIAQGEEATDSDGACCYRHDGKACAIGGVIPDSDYKPEYEDRSVNALIFEVEDFAWMVPHRALLSELQGVHDRVKPQQWPSALKEIRDWFFGSGPGTQS